MIDPLPIMLRVARLPAPLADRLLDVAFGKADEPIEGYHPERLRPGPMPKR